MKKLTSAIVLLVLLSGCGKDDDADGRTYFLTVFGIDNAKVTLNGEPALAGGLVSLFIQDGDNELVIRGDVSDGYAIWFGRTKGFSDANPQTLWEVKDAPERAETDKLFRFQFTASRSGRWSWEDADTITELTAEDRSAILRLFDRFVERLRDKSTIAQGIFQTETSLPWSRDPQKLAEAKATFTELLAEVRSYDDLTCRKARPEELLFERGRKTVALRAGGEHLYYLGHADGYEPEDSEVVWSIAADVVHFARFDGRWKTLLVTP